MKGLKFAILHHGYIENDFAWNVAVPKPGNIKEKNVLSEWIRVPTFSVLISHPDLGWILYDTGPCLGDEKDRLPLFVREQFPLFTSREEFLDKQLSLVNLTPEDISLIIVSHMHWDHAGGLSFFSNTKASKNILVSEKDYSYGLTVTHHCSTEPFGGGGYFKDNFHFPGLTFNFIEEDQSLAPGIDIITLGGHTPGVLGLVLHLESDAFIFPSDAVNMSRNYGPPMAYPGILYDSIGFQQTVRKLNLLQKTYQAKIIFPHDPVQFSYLEPAPYFYQ